MDQQSGASKDQKGHQCHGGGEEVRYAGVVRQRSGSYGARICGKTKRKGVQVWLGTFPTPEEAARAYDRAAVTMGRPINTLNFPHEHRNPGGAANASTLPAVATATSSSSTSSMATREVIEFECLEDLLDPDIYDEDQVNK